MTTNVTEPAQSSPPSPAATQSVPDHHAEWSWGQYLQGLAARIVIFFLIYVFSIGPMFWIWYEGKHSSMGPKWAAALYEPLLRLADRWPLFGKWLNRYIEWWI